MKYSLPISSLLSLTASQDQRNLKSNQKLPPSPSQQNNFYTAGRPRNNNFGQLYPDFLASSYRKFQLCAPSNTFRYTSSLPVFTRQNSPNFGYSSEPAPRLKVANGPDGNIYITSRGGPGLQQSKTCYDGEVCTVRQPQSWVYSFIDGNSQSKQMLPYEHDCILNLDGTFFISEDADGRMYPNACSTNLFDYWNDPDPMICRLNVVDGQVLNLREQNLFFSAFVENDVVLVMGGQRSRTQTYENENSNPTPSTGWSNDDFVSGFNDDDYVPVKNSYTMNVAVDGAIGFTVNMKDDQGKDISSTFLKIYRNLNNGYFYNSIDPLFAWNRDMSPLNLVFNRETKTFDEQSNDEFHRRCEEFFPAEGSQTELDGAHLGGVEPIVENVTDNNSTRRLEPRWLPGENAEWVAMDEICDQIKTEKRTGKIVGIVFGVLGAIGLAALGGACVKRRCEDGGSYSMNSGPGCCDLGRCADSAVAGTGAACNRVAEGCQSMKEGTVKLFDGTKSCVGAGCVMMTAPIMGLCALFGSDDDSTGSGEKPSSSVSSEKPVIPEEIDIPVIVESEDALTGTDIEEEIAVTGLTMGYGTIEDEKSESKSRGVSTSTADNEDAGVLGLISGSLGGAYNYFMGRGADEEQ